MLKLTGRYYRTIPITDPGYVYEEIEILESRTALVAMHCWNIGCEGGPEIDPNFWVGMGFPVAHREAERIMRERIRPAMDAARRIGMLVCHVESETIRTNRSLEAQEGPQAREDPGWRERMAWRSHGREYATLSPLSRMDRATIVSPLDDEPLVFTTDELHEVLQDRGMDTMIYSGFATDMCVLRAPGGIESIAPHDYRLMMLRDATLGVECPDTFEERIATRWGVRYFETHFGDTFTTEEFLRACQRI
jgi:nicotinamidase-related amidase